mgnify:FL=1
MEATGHPKFPFRIRIIRGDEILLCLRVQDRWPGTRGHIFCLREDPQTQASLYPAEEIEKVPVISMKRYGKRLAIVLDRAINKRCEFLFLKKKYKQKEGEYEQIEWGQIEWGRASRFPLLSIRKRDAPDNLSCLSTTPAR